MPFPIKEDFLSFWQFLLVAICWSEDNFQKYSIVAGGGNGQGWNLVRTKMSQSQNNSVIKLDGRALRLLSSGTVLKEYDMPWHYQSKHLSQDSQFTGKQQSEKLDNLKWNICSQQNFFTKGKKWKWGCNQMEFLISTFISRAKKATHQ